MSLLSQEGTEHGDLLSMVLFSIGAHPIVLNINAQFRPILHVLKADDGNFIGPIEGILKVYEYIKEKEPASGIRMQQSKNESVVAKNCIFEAKWIRLQSTS